MTKGTSKGFFRKIGKTIAHPFVVLFNNVKSSKLTTLVLMQLKDKWNLSFKANKKASIFKLITYVIIFAAICALSYLIMSVLVKTLNIFVSPFFPATAMCVVLTVLTLFEGLSILIRLTNSLYFSKDNTTLITYPVKADYLFISKMIVYLFDAIKNAFTLFVPVLMAYGLINGAPAGFFFWMPFCVIIYMFVLVAICGLLSIPAYFVMRFLKKYRVIKIIVATIVLAGLITAAVFVIRLIPSNINLIRTFEKFSMGLTNFLLGFKKTFMGMFYITTLLCGESKGYYYRLFTPVSGFTMLAFLAIIVLFTFLDFKVSKPFYNKMISSRNNFETKLASMKDNKKSGKFTSLVKFETLRIVRNEKILVTSLIAIISTPIFMLLADKIYIAFSTRLIGDIMIVCFNILLILLFTITHNVSTSYIYSKDGPSWNINKTMPVDPRPALISRLIYNSVVSILVFLPSVFILFNTGKISPAECVFIALLLFVLSNFHILVSASYDFMHSENKTKADIGSEYISKHEARSVVFGLLVSFGAAGLGLIMGLTGTKNIYLRLFIIACVILAFELYLFFKKIVATYQEN